jgi:hypothetical protein
MDKGRFRVGLSMLGSYVHAAHAVMPDQREPGVALADQPAEHVLDIGLLQWDLDAQAGVHRRFAFELLLPVRTTIIAATFEDGQGRELPRFQSIHHRDETIAGIGDLILGGRIGLVLPDDVPRWTLALRTGVSLPTGKTEPNPFVLGAQGKAHQHMFFGTGTVDPVVGVDTNVAFDRWALVGWTVSKIPLYANRHGYRASTVVVGGVGALSGFGLARWSFLLQPEVYFETPARWDGMHDLNSGRTSLIATAGAFVMPAPGWQVHLLAKVPYYTWAQGGQLRWPFVAVDGFSYTFDVGNR